MANQFTIDRLSVSICHDKHELGRIAADTAEQCMGKALDERGEAVIVLATGASQFEFLDSLNRRRIDWKKVVAFHLDEYVGIDENHPASFRRYLKERIIDKAGIGTCFLIQGDARDTDAECKRLENAFKRYSVDVAFVGIGENGHLAFNDPPARFEDPVSFKTVELDPKCRAQQLGEGWFKTLEDVPHHAITMTIPAIMASKTIVCSVPDLRKAEAVKNTLMEKVSPQHPASILRKHGNAYLFLDPPSASLLTRL